MAIIKVLIHLIQQSFRKSYIDQRAIQRQSQNQKIKQQNPMEQSRQRYTRRSVGNPSPQDQNAGRHGPSRREVHLINGAINGRIPSEDNEAYEDQDMLMDLEAENNLNANNEQNPTVQKYSIVNQNTLQGLIPQVKKQIVYQKLIIIGIVWNKEVNNLFDYEQKDKTIKSTIVIESDLKKCMNFIDNQALMTPPCQNDIFLIIYKSNSDKKLSYERKLLSGIYTKSLISQVVSQQTETNKQKQSPKPEKQFVCCLKIIANSHTKLLSIKVFSVDQILKLIQSIRSLNHKNVSFQSENNLSQKVQTNSLQCFQQVSEQILQSLPNKRSHDPYFIIRTLHKTDPAESKGQKIYPGDLIKLGKVQFKVISLDGISVEDINNQFDKRAIEVTQIDQETQKDIECKYCLGGKAEEHENNFFLHLCDCKGHIGYVHYNCLTTWTTTKASIQTSEQVKMYFLEKMKCEVCLKQFPKYFRYKDKLYHLLPIELPKKHIMLVNLSQKQDAITAVINGDNQKQIKIGRGRDAMLRVTDITVSREHAVIQRIGEDYYIRDSRSKFGTLIRSTQEQLEVQIGHKKGIQINNLIFTIQVVKKEVQVQKLQQNGKKSQINRQETVRTESINEQRHQENAIKEENSNDERQKVKNSLKVQEKSLKQQDEQIYKFDKFNKSNQIKKLTIKQNPQEKQNCIQNLIIEQEQQEQIELQNNQNDKNCSTNQVKNQKDDRKQNFEEEKADEIEQNTRSTGKWTLFKPIQLEVMKSTDEKHPTNKSTKQKKIVQIKQQKQVAMTAYTDELRSISYAAQESENNKKQGPNTRKYQQQSQNDSNDLNSQNP